MFKTMKYFQIREHSEKPKNIKEELPNLNNMLPKLKVTIAEGGPYERGLKHGAYFRDEIKHNLTSFWQHVLDLGASRNSLLRLVQNIHKSDLNETSLLYFSGISEGAGVALPDVLTLNLLKPVLYPDECTVLIAFGDSTANGKTIMLKNSDKIGSERFKGDRFYKNKELNVLILEKPDNGNTIAAIAAAGEEAIKIGLNDKGVAFGSNIARTVELSARTLNVSQIRALDRGWLGKEGLTKANTAREAAQLVLKSLAERPMSTPGNIEFVDPKKGFIIEGSYDRLAFQEVDQGTHARTNKFEILKDLNDPFDVSSYVRYVRSIELLRMNRGKIDVPMMIRFSQDHENGPGLNSICRHSPNYTDETSLAAAVMELDPVKPESSIFHAALGKPCRAWNDPKGHISIRMNELPVIPPEFLNGDTFKKFYIEEL